LRKNSSKRSLKKRLQRCLNTSWQRKMRPERRSRQERTSPHCLSEEMYFNEMYNKLASLNAIQRKKLLTKKLRMSSKVPWPLIGGLVGVFVVILMIGACYVAYAAWKKKREGPEVRYCHKTNTKIIPPAPSSEPKIVKGKFIIVKFCFVIKLCFQETSRTRRKHSLHAKKRDLPIVTNVIALTKKCDER